MGRNENELSIGSFNCRGIFSDSVKRRGVFNRMREKFDICILLETHANKDVEKYWLAEWGYTGWFSSFRSNARGVAILFKNSFSFECHKYIEDPEGRYGILDVSIMKTKFTLVAIYGPNQDDPNFFKHIQDHVTELNNENIIAVGDWNVVLDYKMDTKNYLGRNNRQANKKILEMIEDLDLVDIWRERFPNNCTYTWHGPHRKMARLDYFLISSHISDKVRSVSISPGINSDHSHIGMKISLAGQEKGKGFWKFNNSLLKDPQYVEIVKKCIEEVTELYQAEYQIENTNEINYDNMEFTINDQLLFDTLKLSIRGQTIPYCAKKKREREEKEVQIKEKLEQAEREYQQNPSDNTLSELETYQNEMTKIIDSKAKGSMIRAKARWMAEGEKCTKYFCGLENRHYKDKTITKLITDKGEITDIKEILECQQNYYADLYKSRHCHLSEENRNIFLNKENPYLNFLTKEESEECEGKITKEECLEALKNMKNNKSPGSDGFTCEFYKFFWKDIGSFLVRSINCAYDNGQLSIMQRLGIITSIPKENKDRNFIKKTGDLYLYLTLIIK